MDDGLLSRPMVARHAPSVKSIVLIQIIN